VLSRPGEQTPFSVRISPDHRRLASSYPRRALAPDGLGSRCRPARRSPLHPGCIRIATCSNSARLGLPGDSPVSSDKPSLDAATHSSGTWRLGHHSPGARAPIRDGGSSARGQGTTSMPGLCAQKDNPYPFRRRGGDRPPKGLNPAERDPQDRRSSSTLHTGDNGQALYEDY